MMGRGYYTQKEVIEQRQLAGSEQMQQWLEAVLDLRSSTHWIDRSGLLQGHATTLIDEQLLRPVTGRQVQERLAQLCLLERRNRSQQLELAQLYAWLAKSSLFHQISNVPHSTPSKGEIEECWFSADWYRKSCLHWLCEARAPFWRGGYNRQLRRLVMQEPEASLQFLQEALEACRDSLCERLCHTLREPYRLSRQLVLRTLKTISRLERSIESLERPTPSASYFESLLLRTDRLFKELCHMVRLLVAYRSLQEPLARRATQLWERLVALYHQLLPRVKGRDYWRLWARRAILLLGSRQGPTPLQREELLLEGLRGQKEIEEEPELLLLIGVIALLAAGLEEEAALPVAGIEGVGQALDRVKKSAPASLRGAIERSQVDLHLLYHRASTAKSIRVLCLGGGLLSLGSSVSAQEQLTVCLQLLEDLYDLWSGAR